MVKIAVTGAAGFIGSHTVDQLLQAGHAVWGIDNFRTGLRENLAGALKHRAFLLHEIDVAEEIDFIDLAGQIRPDVIIHLAALVSVPESIANPALNDRLNLQATRVVAEAARRHRIPRVVFASSAAVYGDPAGHPAAEDAPGKPLSPYGSAKLASEKLLLDYAGSYDLTVRCQRYFNVYGPRQDPRSAYSGVISVFLGQLERGAAPVIFGDGEQTRDFISVHDVARANLIAAIQPGLPSGAADICTGRATSIKELWSLLSRDLPQAAPPTHVAVRPGDIVHSRGSPEAARRDLGFSAATALAAGLAELRQPAGDPSRPLPASPNQAM
jgi:UDP-glucose 4-epimerase